MNTALNNLIKYSSEIYKYDLWIWKSISLKYLFTRKIIVTNGLIEFQAEHPYPIDELHILFDK